MVNYLDTSYSYQETQSQINRGEISAAAGMHGNESHNDVFLTAATIPTASASVKGGVKIDGNGLSIDPMTAILSTVGGGVPSPHNLVDGTNHPVSGLTTGHFLKATGATTYGFEAHGLTYASVGAIADPGTVTDNEILRWNGTTGAAVHTSSGVLIDDSSNVVAAGNVIAYQTTAPSGDLWDDMPYANATEVGGFKLYTTQFHMDAGFLHINDSIIVPAAHNQAWSTITATPTTLAGYGLTGNQTVAGAWAFNGAVAYAGGNYSTKFTNGDLWFNDGIWATFGTDADSYQFFSHTSDSKMCFSLDYYGAATRFLFRGKDAGGTLREMLSIYPRGAVELNYIGSKKLETTNTGVTITGELTTTGGNSTNWQTAYTWGDWSTQMGLRAPINNPIFTGTVKSDGLVHLKQNLIVRHIDGKDWDDYSTNGDLYLQYNNTTKNTVINARGGYVGIGTSSPGVSLDVNGAIRTLAGNKIYLDSAGATQIFYTIWSNDTGHELTVEPSGDGQPASNIRFKTGNYSTGNRQDTLYLHQNNRVGVCNTSPAHELDVTGTIVASGDIIAYHST